MSGRDADSTRLVVSACSSFFTFLERRFDEIRNPFRGSRARPASTWTEAVIPTAGSWRSSRPRPSRHSPRPWRWPSKQASALGGCRGSRVREDGTWHTVSKAHRLHSAEPLSAETLGAFKAAPAGSPPAVRTRRASRGALAGWTGRRRAARKQLLIAWLKTRLARLCAQLMIDGKLGAVYSWHDLRHAFAERNADRGLVWLRDRLGHSSVSVTERYLRNVLNVDTGKM